MPLTTKIWLAQIVNRLYLLAGYMTTLQKRLLLTASLLMAIAVGIGAFGAHALSEHLSIKDLEVYKTANFYHFIHSLGILSLVPLVKKLHSFNLKWVGFLFGIGILLFSFSLYTLAISETVFGDRMESLGMITPLGGVCFIAGWLTLAISAIKANSTSTVKKAS